MTDIQKTMVWHSKQIVVNGSLLLLIAIVCESVTYLDIVYNHNLDILVVIVIVLVIICVGS